MAWYILDIPGYARRSMWRYDELRDVLVASVLHDSAAPGAEPTNVTAVTIDQLLDRLDEATGSRHGMQRMVLHLGRAEVNEPARSWLASRIRLVTDRDVLIEAAQSNVPWLAAEARNHSLFEEPEVGSTTCPLCGNTVGV
ncbi:hypothetical protein [Leifsonia sp. 1010]|uniref:hypothetical protein n=1 Tax=Leifsonia sp. 1010 TaxID=2817769 RepID=UPI002854E6BE|nr:hypothetical protein [Leifsonia sp. 1010]MDR6613837.1 formate dehydrogenase maturation protein FdhE [Leifsonia sp. 1010]